MTIQNLRNCFMTAEEKGADFIGVKIEMNGFEEPEVIINPRKNFEKKLAYYTNAYNEDLTLKAAPDKVKIIGFTYARFYDDIENDLVIC